ncbi:transporter [Polaribacter sp.]|uniref:transporter n=1 Tax=Polaribacter sp. TaxID=1920175 RepID=UPI003F6C0241
MVNNSIQKFFSIVFLFGFSSIYSQYTEVINSNKPGFSESPYSVGTGVYQLETNIFFRDTQIDPTFSRPESLGFDLLFRTSFFLEKLELNVQVTQQKDKIAFKNIFTSHYFESNISRLNVSAKYLLYQPKYKDKSKEIRSWKKRFAFDKRRLIPSVAIYAGANTDFVGDYYKTGTISPKLGLLLQHNLTNKFNIITNVFYDKIGTDFSEISYIVTGTYNFSNKWSTFIENQMQFQEFQNNINFGTGLAFLYNNNLQLNASGRILTEGSTPGYYASFGVSYRVNTHKDAFKELDENGRVIKETPISKYNKKQKGFFSRLFSIFSKKDKRKKSRSRSRRKRNN